MDGNETIQRRDAVGGLSLLGALILTLVGTIVYRIVDSAPAGPPRPREGWDMAAGDGLGSRAVVTAESRETVDSTVQGPLDQIRDEEVRAASHAAPGDSLREPSEPLSEAPRFVPPGVQ